MQANPAITDVLQHPGVWRRSTPSMAFQRTVSTGLGELDARLPGGGWPLGALSEVLFDHDGLGEFRLLMPALATLTAQRKRVVMVNPPYVPYAPALAAAGIDLHFLSELKAPADDAAWSLEQCLRSGCCAAVIGWLPQADYRSLRRLHLAAESSDALAVIYRPAHPHLAQTSPAPLRLHVRAEQGAACVDVVKARGGLGAAAGAAGVPPVPSLMH